MLGILATHMRQRGRAGAGVTISHMYKCVNWKCVFANSTLPETPSESGVTARIKHHPHQTKTKITEEVIHNRLGPRPERRSSTTSTRVGSS